MAQMKTIVIHIHEDNNIQGICGRTRTVPEEGFLVMCEACLDIYREQKVRQTGAPTS